MTDLRVIRTFCVVVALGALASCGQFAVSSISLPGAGCSLTELGGVVGAASLPITADGANTAYLAVSIAGYGAERGEVFYVDEIGYSYDSQPLPKLVGLVPETVPVAFALVRDPTTILMPILGDGAAVKLPSALSPGDRKKLLVTFEVRGHVAGSGARFSTDKVTFPVELFRTADCKPGLVPVTSTARCLESCYQPNGDPRCFDRAVGPPAVDGGC